jgi:hypothetical protein
VPLDSVRAGADGTNRSLQFGFVATELRRPVFHFVGFVDVRFARVLRARLGFVVSLGCLEVGLTSRVVRGTEESARKLRGSR